MKTACVKAVFNSHDYCSRICHSKYGDIFINSQPSSLYSSVEWCKIHGSELALIPNQEIYEILKDSMPGFPLCYKYYRVGSDVTMDWYKSNVSVEMLRRFKTVALDLFLGDTPRYILNEAQFPFICFKVGDNLSFHGNLTSHRATGNNPLLAAANVNQVTSASSNQALTTALLLGGILTLLLSLTVVFRLVLRRQKLKSYETRNHRHSSHSTRGICYEDSNLRHHARHEMTCVRDPPPPYVVRSDVIPRDVIPLGDQAVYFTRSSNVPVGLGITPALTPQETPQPRFSSEQNKSSFNSTSLYHCRESNPRPRELAYHFIPDVIRCEELSGSDDNGPL